MLAAIRCRLVARDRLARSTLAHMDRHDIMAPKRCDHSPDKCLCSEALTRFLRLLLAQRLVGRLAHQAQDPAHTLVWHDVEERRLCKADSYRFRHRSVKDALVRGIPEVSDQDRIAIRQHRRSTTQDECSRGGSKSEHERRTCSQPRQRHAMLRNQHTRAPPIVELSAERVGNRALLMLMSMNRQ